MGLLKKMALRRCRAAHVVVPFPSHGSPFRFETRPSQSVPGTGRRTEIIPCAGNFRRCDRVSRRTSHAAGSRRVLAEEK
jgi:hypothetical protein